MKRLLILAMLIATPAYATDQSKIEVRGSINDEQSDLMDTGLIVKTFSSGAVQMNKVSVDAASTASVTVPSGAKAILIDVGTYKNLVLKGVSGDTGISLDSTTPVLLPISSDGNTTVVIRNKSSNQGASLRVYFF